MSISIYFAIPAAIIVAFIFALGFKDSRPPWNNLWAFFMIIFFVIWMLFDMMHLAGISTTATAWVPSLFLGILLTIMLAGIFATTET